MLRELNISNFAIIDQQQISFGEGLNVISGETGAGKSIILNAIELILGGRPKAQSIRSGCEEMEVEALFDLSTIEPKTMAELPDIAQKDELLINRTVSLSGRSKVYLNGRIATVSLLEEICSRLVNICGQSQHIKLLDETFHIELLDNFAGLESRVQKYQTSYTQWRQLCSRIEHINHASADSSRRRDELNELVEEVESAQLSVGLREQLEAKLKRLSNAEQLIAGVQALSSGLGDESGLMPRLQFVGGRLAELSKLDSGLIDILKRFNAARIEITEIESELSAFARRIEIDEEQLASTRDQLAEVARLERKYKSNCAGILEICNRARTELQSLSGAEGIEKLEAEESALRTELLSQAEVLSKLRKTSALNLSIEVQKELAELNMADAQLSVHFSGLENNSDTATKLNARGFDRLSLQIATNKGEPLKPLKEVASGGELSRITLVLKKVLREKTGVNVLVFDEVDTGVSGSVARAVGEKLKALAGPGAGGGASSQVICISHLPQVASLADHHFLVSKRSGDRTISEIRELKSDERVDEVARMLAGYKITEASRSSARELLGLR